MSDLDLRNPYEPEGFERLPQLGAVPPRRTAPEGPAPPPSSPPPAAGPDEKAGEGPVPWKAAASSVPRLRQQPATQETPSTEGGFQGFAQDAMPGRTSTIGESAAWGDAGPDDGPTRPARSLAAEPPIWVAWLEQLRVLPRPLTLGACAVVVLGVVLLFVLRPGEQPSTSLSRIRQHPEAFDGKLVAVRGRAGETFLVGGSYVFNLRQGRDTIVVYSRTRRPSPNETVRATGTVSVGFLDGAPRVALFEDPPTP